MTFLFLFFFWLIAHFFGDLPYFSPINRLETGKSLQLSLLRTPFSWTGIIQKITGGSPGQVNQICNSVFCGFPSPGQVIFNKKLKIMGGSPGQVKICNSIFCGHPSPEDRKINLQPSLLRTPFSWTGHFQLGLFQ